MAVSPNHSRFHDMWAHVGTYGKGGSPICEAVNKHFAVADDSLNDLLWMFILSYPPAWGFLKRGYNSKFHHVMGDFPCQPAIGVAL